MIKIIIEIHTKGEFNMDKRKTARPPKLPIDDYIWILDHCGEDEANQIFEKVQNDEMTVEHVERVMKRPEIEPEDWRDFEEGWRPDGW